VTRRSDSRPLYGHSHPVVSTQYALTGLSAGHASAVLFYRDPLEVTMSLPSYAINQASFPYMYEEWPVGPLFRPWAELTLDEINLAPGDRLLDIAC
jgi:hypothetical protein